MKIVFFGTSQFAVTAIRKLYESGHLLIACVTQPDRKSGRNLKISGSPVKKEAQRFKIPVYQPEDILEERFIEMLEGIDADFFIVVGFGKVLPKEILDIPRYCCLNIHASLLPKYRGAAPINWALINGEKKTGVSIIRMNERLDAGEIVRQKEVDIKLDDDSQSLDIKLANLGAEMVIETIELIEKGKANFVKQNEEDATFAPKLTKKDGKINWNSTTAEILNRIRGLKPWPGTYSFLNGHMFKVISAKSADESDYFNFSPGEVVIADDKKGFVVKTRDGALSILELQIEGKREMTAELFLRGHEIRVGTKLFFP